MPLMEPPSRRRRVALGFATALCGVALWHAASPARGGAARRGDVAALDARPRNATRASGDDAAALDAQRRRLAGTYGRAFSSYTSWHTPTKESTDTANGVVPVITCPPGKYRNSGVSTSMRRSNGQRIEGCSDCPPGRYGEVWGLTSSSCTSDCPTGRYRDLPAGVTEEDCTFCPEGTYGDRVGLTTFRCSGNCPDGEYSDVAGLKDENDCKECPTGYRGWQCSWEIKAQNYDKTKVHAYDKDEYTTNNAEHPQGLSPVSFYDMTKPLVNCQGDDDVSLDNPRCAT